ALGRWRELRGAHQGIAPGVRGALGRWRELRGAHQGMALASGVATLYSQSGDLKSFAAPEGACDYSAGATCGGPKRQVYVRNTWRLR
ncbi:MAG: hypothetical protein J4N63_06975, partial [Chloroflexi bacterium]|nr:hypothetical protein [Chloroflexota bacterium]